MNRYDSEDRARTLFFAWVVLMVLLIGWMMLVPYETRAIVSEAVLGFR